MKEFRIGNEPGPRHTDAVAGMLFRPRLGVPRSDYPGKLEWNHKAIAEVQSEKKHAMAAWWGNEDVALCIYQQHPTEPSKVEIRNFSVETSARGRGLASFVMKQTVIEAALEYSEADTKVVDTKLSNTDMIGFALSHGFTVQGITVLESDFGTNREEDMVLSMPLPPQQPV